MNIKENKESDLSYLQDYASLQERITLLEITNKRLKSENKELKKIINIPGLDREADLLNNMHQKYKKECFRNVKLIKENKDLKEYVKDLRDEIEDLEEILEV